MNNENNHSKSFLELVNKSLWTITQDGFRELSTKIFNFKDDSKKADTLKDRIKLDELNGYGYEVVNGNAIINFHGPHEKRFNIWSWFFGMTSTEMIKMDIENALNDDSVNMIIFNVDSPGGTVDGSKDLSDFIFQNRGKKKMVAYADGMMASGAYYILSAVDQIFTNETSYIGSIGVYRMHVDASKYYDEMGIKIKLIHAGKEKIVGNQFEELSKEDEKILQSEVDDQYNIFVETVARNRGVDKKTVISEMADGKIFIGEQALKNGLVDGIGSYEEVVSYVNIDSFPDVKTSSKSFSQSKKEFFMNLLGKKPDELTLEVLKEKFTDLYNIVINIGKEECKTEMKPEIDKNISNAVSAESERAKSIFGLVEKKPALLGEAISLFSEGKSAGDAAVELFKKSSELDAKNSSIGSFMQGATEDTGSVENEADEAAKSTPAQIWESDKSLQEVYKNKGGKESFINQMNEWNKNEEKLQESFGGNVESFLALKRNIKK